MANVSSNATGWSLTGGAATVPGVAVADLLANLSLGRAVVNIYTANFPQPLQPMGCCNNAEARSLNQSQTPPMQKRCLRSGFQHALLFRTLLRHVGAAPDLVMQACLSTSWTSLGTA